MLAHAVHLALVAAGLAGLGALLAPTVAPRSRPGPARDLHDARVGALRAAVARYAEDGSLDGLLAAPQRPARLAAAGSTLLVPLAVTASLGAAGVHAAMFPSHLRERLVFGAFFLGSALAQLAWAERALRRPTRGWLLLGAAGNLGVLALWAVTRTVGLPFGLLPTPEEVGAWDVTCAVLEATVIGACVVGLRRGARPAAPWRDWHEAAYAWAALVATLLVVLPMGGGH